MCRFIAYIGPPVRVAELIIRPPHSLLEQCRTPRHQTRTKDNPDGYGLAWFDGARALLHRRPVPMWGDPDFPRLAETIESRAFVAAIRKATPGIALGETNTPPYVAGKLVFAHNGAVGGWVEGNDARARAMVSPARAAEIRGTTDSEVLLAALLTKMDGGTGAAEAMEDLVAGVGARFGGWLNLPLHDGAGIVATAWGNSLFVCERDDGMIVASEPFDDEGDWIPIPDRTLVETAEGAVRLRALPEPVTSP